jgi:Beta-galactosidase/beta-glucuronidase
MHRFVFLAVTGLFSLSNLPAAPVPLVRDGAPVAKIYLTEPSPASANGKKGGGKTPDASRRLRSAVDDLNYHIEKMTGSALEVVYTDSPAEIREPAVVIGPLAQKCGLEISATPHRNSIRLLTGDNRLLIAGETDSATVSGIYTLLGKLGCDWVMPGPIGEIIPRHATLTVPELDLTETPSFAGRNLWYRGGKKLNTEEDLKNFDLWRQRQRLDAPGETIDLGAGHVWDVLIKRNKEAFEKDPTMLALVRDEKGELVRSGPQIESTHPGIIDLFVKQIGETFAKNNWPKDKAVAFGIGPADGLGFSVSPETVSAGAGRVDPLTGSPDMTDVCVLLGNKILERIGKEYPNVSLGYYSYSVHADYPARYRPHPRLNQIFAPINFSRFHSPLSPNSKTWPYYVEVVEKWSALAKEQGNQLAYRGYNWNLAENFAPYSKLQIYGEEIPWYHDMGFIVVNIEATKAWAVNGPSDYLLVKLLWNCDQDWKAVLREYCEKSFAEGAGDMERYFLNLTARQHEAGQEAGSYHALHLIYDRDFVAESKKLISAAIAKASEPEARTRAGYFLFPLEELELYLKFREAFTNFDFPLAADYFRQLHANWEQAYASNTQIVAREVPQYLKRYFEKFVTEGAKYSTAPYRIVLPLPDELPTQMDPAGVGERMGFQRPELNDSLFLKTRTWSATWDAQGLGALRSGAVWYRFHFDTPADLGDQALGLFVGGVEDQVDVWLNGEKVGSSPRGFSVPFVFDLSKAVKPSGSNVLVMKVSRRSTINEIGLGGIIRPCFLFAGPPVGTDSSQEVPAGRVLPGGEVQN